MGNIVITPWTEEQIECLNNYQNAGVVHPFTCGKNDCRDILVATKDCWKCPSCDYIQNWALDFMVTWKADKLLFKGG